MKKCTTCNVEKPLDEFHRGEAYKDGRRCICKSCTSELHAKRYVKKTPDYFIERKKKRELEKIELRVKLDEIRAIDKLERAKTRLEQTKVRVENRKIKRKEQRLSERRVPFSRRAERNNAKHGTSGKLPHNVVYTLLLTQSCGCAYCGKNILTDNHLDHKVPTSRGGENTLSNVHLTCPTCNIQKGQMTHDEYVNFLLPDFLK